MSPKRLAVIDLGSNTFHLLIVEFQDDGSWKPVFKDRRYVKLASGGLEKIPRENVDRAISVMKEFSNRIIDFHADLTLAIGTAALREARNGHEVARQIEQASGIRIEIIDGRMEAGYILKGIQSALPALDKPGLVMDIGGGSVEFILYNQHGMLYAESFKIGVAVLYRQFHHHDPIQAEEIAALEQFVAAQLHDLLGVLDGLEAYYLIGASGSFEIIQDFMPKLNESGHWSELHLTGLLDYLEQIIHLDLAARKIRREIPEERLDYVVVAYLLIRFLIRYKSPERLFYCDFALKEGIISTYRMDNFRQV